MRTYNGKINGYSLYLCFIYIRFVMLKKLILLLTATCISCTSTVTTSTTIVDPMMGVNQAKNVRLVEPDNNPKKKEIKKRKKGFRNKKFKSRKNKNTSGQYLYDYIWIGYVICIIPLIFIIKDAITFLSTPDLQLNLFKDYITLPQPTQDIRDNPALYQAEINSLKNTIHDITPLYRPLSKQSDQPNTNTETQQIIAQLQQENNQIIPAYFHASSPNKINKILKSGEGFSTYKQLSPGFFVSNQFEDGFGKCGFGFSREIEQHDLLISHQDNDQDSKLGTCYWAGYPTTMPIWLYLQVIYIHNTVSAKDRAMITKTMNESKQKIRTFLLAKLNDNPSNTERHRINKLMQNVANVKITTYNSAFDIPTNKFIPRSWIKYHDWTFFTTDKDKHPEFVSKTTLRRRQLRDPHGNTIKVSLFSLCRTIKS